MFFLKGNIDFLCLVCMPNVRKVCGWSTSIGTLTGFVQSLEFLKKSGNLRTTFPDLEKVWKLKAKSWKMGLSLEFFLRSSRCLKASWNLCNVADFTWINLANGKTLHNKRRYGRRILTDWFKSESPVSNALHCIMVHSVCNASWFICFRVSWGVTTSRATSRG